MYNKIVEKKNSNIIKNFINILPFISIIAIGLIYADITLHQKVFKTFLIFLINNILAFGLFFQINRYKNSTEKSNYLLYFLLYFIYIFIQYIVSFLSKEISYDRDYHLGNYIILITFATLLFLMLNDFKQLYYDFILLALFLIALFMWSLIELLFSGTFSNFRPKLSFGNTDYLAGYLIGFLPLTTGGAILFLADFFKKRDNFNKLFFIVSSVGTIAGILLLIFTQTKSAIFGWYIGFVVIFISLGIIILSTKKNKTLFVFSYITILIFLPLILLLFPPPFFKTIFKRIYDAFPYIDFFLKDRIENGWAGAINLFKNHPIFGAGLGTVYPASFKYINKYFFLYSESNSFKHSHCEYIEILGEGGLFGLLFFAILILYILVSLFLIIFSNKKNSDIKIISASLISGLISMLIHQIFSLSLRMSVTMVAFFTLIAISLFVIHTSEKLNFNNKNSEINLEKKTFPNKLLVIILITLIFNLIALFLILPVLKSEINIVKSSEALEYSSAINKYAKNDQDNIEKYKFLFNKYHKLSNNYIKKAIFEKRDNPYAWTQKYIIDTAINLPLAETREEFNSIFAEIKADLDNLNLIIPDYQDVWSKYVSYYLKVSKYYEDDGNFTKSTEQLKNALYAAEKSLEKHFLNEYTHINRIVLTIRLGEEEKLFENLKEYIIAKIYLDFAKKRKIIKEKIIIKDAEESNLRKEDNKFYFAISKKDINIILEKLLKVKIVDYINLKYYINSEIENFFKEKYEVF